MVFEALFGGFLLHRSALLRRISTGFPTHFTRAEKHPVRECQRGSLHPERLYAELHRVVPLMDVSAKGATVEYPTFSALAFDLISLSEGREQYAAAEIRHLS